MFVFSSNLFHFTDDTFVYIVLNCVDSLLMLLFLYLEAERRVCKEHYQWLFKNRGIKGKEYVRVAGGMDAVWWKGEWNGPMFINARCVGGGGEANPKRPTCPWALENGDAEEKWDWCKLLFKGRENQMLLANDKWQNSCLHAMAWLSI